MLAHYVLGFAYRDMGDSLSALRCFNEAVAVADTSDANCDIHPSADITSLYRF